MKYLFCLLALFFVSCFSLAQSPFHKTTGPSDGFSTVKYYNWNDTLQTWDPFSKIDYGWNGNLVQYSVYYPYTNGSYQLLDSTHATSTPGQIRIRGYEWDGMAYTMNFIWDEDYDSLDNITRSLAASFNNGSWTTLQYFSYLYQYSGNANYDTMQVLDLTEPVGNQKSYKEYRHWNAQGTEPDTISAAYYQNDSTLVELYKQYDITWNNFSLLQMNLYTEDWASPINRKERFTLTYGPYGETNRYVEAENNGQFDSLGWRLNQFDAQGCLTKTEIHSYSFNIWVLDSRTMYDHTYDANNRLIATERFSLDTAFSNMVPIQRIEYTYPIVGTDDPLDIGFRATLFPNPSSGPIHLEIGLDYPSDLNFQVWDVNGKIHLQDSWRQEQGVATRTLSPDLAPGVYFYQLQGDAGAKSGSLIRK